ncbi:unnamed protein product [Arabidopsis halleri]
MSDKSRSKPNFEELQFLIQRCAVVLIRRGDFKMISNTSIEENLYKAGDPINPWRPKNNKTDLAEFFWLY